MNEELFRFPEPEPGIDPARMRRSRSRARGRRLATGVVALTFGVGTAGLGLGRLAAVEHEPTSTLTSQGSDTGVAPATPVTGQAPTWEDGAGESETD